MSTQPYEMAIATTRAVMAKVKADQMSSATPCASWKVSDLINHIVGGQHFFAASMEGVAPAGGEQDFSSGDYMAVFDAGAAKAVAAFNSAGAMEKIVHLPFGDMPGAAFVGIAATDTFMHGWDLAKATGQPSDLAPELAAGLLSGVRGAISDNFRGAEGVAPFGAEQKAPAGATNADQLAAFLGRTV